MDKKIAKKLLEGHEFCTNPGGLEDEENDEEEGLDDEELNNGGKLDQEVQEMVKIWNRDEILKDVALLREQRKLKKEKLKYEDYYDGKTSFEELEKTMEPLDESSHVLIKLIQPNPDGKEIAPSDTVLLEYITFLEFEDTPFESTHHDGKPKKIDLSVGPIFPGLLRGILNMREGETANLLVKPNMLSGALPPLGFFNGRVLERSVSFYYHVTVLKIITDSHLDKILKYEDEYNVDYPLEEKLKHIQEHKEVANKLLLENQPREALIRYKAAIEVLGVVDFGELMEDENLKKLMFTLLQNAGITFNKLNMPKAATKYLKRALFIEPDSVKVLYQIAKARVALKDYDRAMKWIAKADKIAPHNNNFLELKKQINLELADERAKRDEIMLKMSKAFIN